MEFVEKFVHVVVSIESFSITLFMWKKSQNINKISYYIARKNNLQFFLL